MIFDNVLTFGIDNVPEGALQLAAMATTGKELLLKRIAMDVSTRDLAARIGVPVSQVSHWEARRTVTDKAAARYLAALATFGTVPTINIDAA